MPGSYLRRQKRRAQKRLATLLAKRTAERDALKVAIHKHARRHGDRHWFELEQTIDALKGELARMERQLVARDPQQRKAMRREQRQQRKAA